MSKTKKLKYVYAVGRRKGAKARARLFTGGGENTANGMVISKYFQGAILEEIWNKPFKAIEGVGKYYVSIKVEGGGKKAQADAAAHAIARALYKLNNDNKKALRKFKLLTRDSRIRERRKVGTGGKARRKKQSPKR